MPKIAIIGAGSHGFTRKLVNDILQVPTLAASTIALMDIDGERLRQAVMLDPLTAAVLRLDEVRRMTDEMLEAQAHWLPWYEG